MLDRALYVRHMYWKNEQHEKAKGEPMDNSASNDANFKPRLRTANNKRADPVIDDDDEPTQGTVKTSRGNLPVVATWDGSTSGGLSVLKNIHMLPPKENP